MTKFTMESRMMGDYHVRFGGQRTRKECQADPTFLYGRKNFYIKIAAYYFF